MTKKINKIIFSLALFSGLCSLFTIIRAVWIQSLYPLYLVWNLILAWLPLLFGYLFFQSYKTRKSIYLSIFWFIIWLIFFPNSFYIITDFIHLYEQTEIPVWYDIAEIFSYTWIGFCTGFISLFFAEKVFKKMLGAWRARGVSFACLILSGVGIYLGRFFRLNSWDLVTAPSGILKAISSLPPYTSYLDILGVVIVFSLVFVCLYQIFTTFLEK